MLKNTARRQTVTVEDRRAILVTARSRKPAEVAKIDDENFIRRQLKARLGWPQTEPAPASVKTAAKEMAAAIKRQRAEAQAAAAKAKEEAAKAAENQAAA